MYLSYLARASLRASTLTPTYATTANYQAPMIQLCTITGFNLEYV
jgi:hypothetical protein